MDANHISSGTSNLHSEMEYIQHLFDRVSVQRIQIETFEIDEYDLILYTVPDTS